MSVGSCANRRILSAVLTKRNVAAVAAVLLVAAVSVLVVPYRTWLYKGPGHLRDLGFLAYPRFRLELPQMTIGRDPSHIFTFERIPSEEMSVMLDVVDASIDDFDRLKTLPIQITARLFEEATFSTPRRRLCEATGSPSGKFPDSQWVATASAVHAAFWHPRCLRMPMRNERSYTLQVEIAPTGSSLPSETLVPTLQGGGFELP